MHKLIEAIKSISRHPAFPLILLLSINMAAGLLTYRDYGLSWDEPLFYDYADAIKLAYSPQAFSPTFDFEQVYGPSATDHKYYGPAYLLAAHPIQQAVMAVLGADRASAWHLVNFLTFQVGLVFFYLLIRRWFDPWPAAAAAAFFAWQPVMWGHAFINPKDMPFMVFFIAAVTLGFWMVDEANPKGLPDIKTGNSSQVTGTQNRLSSKKTFRVFRWGLVLLAGIVLGATTAVRVIGPLAGLVVFAHFVLQKSWRAFPAFLVYGLVSVLVMFVAWPFLWADPVNRLIEVLHHMSYNPTQLAVLFMGQMYRAATLPRRYFPQMLGITLTEPTWILFAASLALALYKTWREREKRFTSALIVTGWFVLMLAYVLIERPPMYDGFRHFLFSVPPVFAVVGFVFQFLYERLRLRLLWVAAVLALLLPGVLGIIQLHPYEYAYYNTFVRGTGGAYRVYETDYWLTCYKESLDWVRANAPDKTVHIQREFPLAAYYGAGLTLKDLGPETETDIRPGDLLLFSTRADLDIRSIYRNLPVIQPIGREGAQFCLIKKKE